MSNTDELRRQSCLVTVASWRTANRIAPATAENLTKWLERPAYAASWPAICDLVERDEVAELARLFWERIPFGTGGRRGPMAEFGSATINRRTIAESAYGLAVYVRETVGTPNLSAAVACDTRINSLEFARATACVLAAQGFTVHLYAEPRSTPQLSFTVRHLGCQCGVMISASHNPPADNGFKAYWSNGAQVLPPHDQGIIARVDSADEIPTVEFETAIAEGRIRLVPSSVDDAFLTAVSAMSLSDCRDIHAVYTPLHGVGETSVYRVLERTGFAGVELFELQRSPDGRFPHVPQHLPNPERAAVFDPAIAASKDRDIDLILASDPDADRLAATVRAKNGTFIPLSGNQLGALLTDYVLGKRSSDGTLTPEHYVIETLVTTPLTAAVAHGYGVRAFRDLPVGFKHIAAVIEREGASQFVFATEESIGFLAGDYCRDKDASIAALWTLELAAELKARGMTLLDRLDELFAMYGVHRESQVSREFPGPQGAGQITEIVRRMREQPPATFGSILWHRVRDYGRKEIRSLPENKQIGTLDVAAGDLLILEGADDSCAIQVAVRPSGTEPKIKFYLFVQTAPEIPLSDAKVWTDRTLHRAQAELEVWIRAIVERG